MYRRPLLVSTHIQGCQGAYQMYIISFINALSSEFNHHPSKVPWCLINVVLSPHATGGYTVIYGVLAVTLLNTSGAGKPSLAGLHEEVPTEYVHDDVTKHIERGEASKPYGSRSLEIGRFLVKVTRFWVTWWKLSGYFWWDAMGNLEGWVDYWAKKWFTACRASYGKATIVIQDIQPTFHIYKLSLSQTPHHHFNKSPQIVPQEKSCPNILFLTPPFRIWVSNVWGILPWLAFLEMNPRLGNEEKEKGPKLKSVLGKRSSGSLRQLRDTIYRVRPLYQRDKTLEGWGNKPRPKSRHNISYRLPFLTIPSSTIASLGPKLRILLPSPLHRFNILQWLYVVTPSRDTFFSLSSPPSFHNLHASSHPMAPSFFARNSADLSHIFIKIHITPKCESVWWYETCETKLQPRWPVWEGHVKLF